MEETNKTQQTVETVQTGTLFVRDIAQIDCAIMDPSSGVSGQSWHVDLTVSGVLDANGFVVDFSPLKSMVRQVLKESVDHALLLPVGSQTVQFSDSANGESWRMRCRPRNSQSDHIWDYQCPKGAVLPIRAVGIKASVVEQEVARILRHRLSERVRNISINLREEKTDSTEATYRYTHGITGHDGLCQRLLHGHRSKIEIFIGEERRPDLEHYIVREVFGSSVHIATPDQIESGNGEIGQRGKTDAHMTLAYKGSLGAYRLTLPSSRVFLVERETSIECISTVIAQVLKREENPRDRLRVICYEGINKGAVAEI
jgi:6-pyruvoyl-tetrahydropterin synthase